MQIGEIICQLKKNGLVKQINNPCEIVVDNITYNSKTANSAYLFVCKGINFKEEYLKMLEFSYTNSHKLLLCRIGSACLDCLSPHKEMLFSFFL